jgi:hypothetical protein
MLTAVNTQPAVLAATSGGASHRIDTASTEAASMSATTIAEPMPIRRTSST